MYYHYCTIGNDTEIVHSPLDKFGRTEVVIEIPDEKYGFKTAKCTIPGYEVSDVYGMTETDMKQFIEFCKHNAALLIELAAKGGVEHA